MDISCTICLARSIRCYTYSLYSMKHINKLIKFINHEQHKNKKIKN
jgi:hypothetical protein